VCQIGSNNPTTVVKAAKLVENDVKSIDINMGCPEHFSVHAGMGAGLLKTPDVAKSIMKALVENINIPVSCKVRLLPKLKDSLDFIKNMQSTGIDHISVHARIREEMSRGFAHWSVIHEAKKDPEITIPINTSGDCFSAKDSYELKKYTQCDGILIARGACHNPAIFKDIKEHWETADQQENEVSILTSQLRMDLTF
jgi:tRNA-dihydrouridine synthase 2